MITTKLKLLLPLLATILLSSCSWEKTDIGGEGTGMGNEVVFSMKIPANYNITRALAPEDEEEVQTLDVLVFDNSTGELLSRSTNSGTPKKEGGNLNFHVRLEKDDNVSSYDFILIANGRDIITRELYSGGELMKDKDKQDIQEVLKAELQAGKGWIADKSEPGYSAIPMWGELINQPIEAGKNYPTARLTRAVVKVDLRVDLTISNSFEMKEVRYYHYNTEGYIIPLATNLENGKAVKPTVDGLTLDTETHIDYSSYITTDGQSLVNSIYGFEADKGEVSDPEYLQNPCLLIKGDFNGTEGWYRLDFAHVNESTHAAEYIPLLRNHHYDVVITAINGPGYPDPDEALNSKPGNIATDVTVWDEGELAGVWNGNYEIKFSALDVNFTQFGQPSPQTVIITTNCPELKFENFTNITKGSGDTDWFDTGDVWSNLHFHVESVKGTTADGKTSYLLSIHSGSTSESDPARESRFTVKGKGLEATFRITQDMHAPWRLIGDPDPMNVIMIDGASQRLRINVTSTHDYVVAINQNGTDMFDGVWDDASGGNSYLNKGIPKSITDIYVNVKKHEYSTPKVGTFVISHADDSSEAPLLTYNVLQVAPVLNAVLTNGGGYVAELPYSGGSEDIWVETNLSEWVPVLSLKIGNGSEQQITGNALRTYFDIVKGSGSAMVKFTAPAMATHGDHYVYTIRFQNTDATTMSAPPIVITQLYKLPASGGGGTPPTVGVRGVENILSVNSMGQLNLDGDGYIVYFKWGSTIAVSGGPLGDKFTSSKIAWVPEEFNYGSFVNLIDSQTQNDRWKAVPYQDTGFDIEDVPVEGRGDPCQLAVKNGVVGEYRMPTGLPAYEAYTTNHSFRVVNGIDGLDMEYKGENQFYPMTGSRNSSNGDVANAIGVSGFYWTSDPSNTTMTTFGSYFYFSRAMILPSAGGSREAGFAIRCMPK